MALSRSDRVAPKGHPVLTTLRRPVFVLLSVLSLLTAHARGEPMMKSSLSDADNLYGKKLYQEALTAYEKASQEEKGEVRLKALFRIADCNIFLFKYEEAVKRLYAEELPKDDLWRARFLLLRTTLGREFLKEYGYALSEDAEEGTTDYTRRTKAEWHAEISHYFKDLWDFREKLVGVKLAGEDYFINLDKADLEKVPTFWDFVVLNWSDYLLTEVPVPSPKEKPEGESFLKKDLKGLMTPEMTSAEVAAELLKMLPKWEEKVGKPPASFGSWPA